MTCMYVAILLSNGSDGPHVKEICELILEGALFTQHRSGEACLRR